MTLICSVYDDAVSAFMTPFFVRTKGEAMRSFTEAVNNPKMEFMRHAKDYSLFCLGTWNDQNGSVSAFELPERLCTALDVREVQDSPVT